MYQKSSGGSLDNAGKVSALSRVSTKLLGIYCPFSKKRRVFRPNKNMGENAFIKKTITGFSSNWLLLANLHLMRHSG